MYLIFDPHLGVYVCAPIVYGVKFLFSCVSGRTGDTQVYFKGFH